MNFSKKDIYLSSSVNSIGKCVSWLNLMACGMSKSVVLIKQKENSSCVINQFTEHKDVVTCVSWLSDNILVSGDNSGVLIFWNIEPNGNLLNFISHKVDKFQSGISDVCGIIIGDDFFVVCCCEERLCLIKVINMLETSELNYITYGIQYVHSVNIIVLKSLMLISCGLSDGRLICQCYDKEQSTLSPASTLGGHEDAIMSIDSIYRNGRVFIATASLDCYVRVWEANIWSPESQQTEIDTQKILCENHCINIRLAAVLAGHENWVTSVNFSNNKSDLMLVSTSMDKSVIVWVQSDSEERCEYSDWSEETRLGQIGGNGLGFIGGSISGSGSMIVSIGYQGAMIVWSQDEQTSLWSSVVNVGGHFDVVEDLAWEESQGRYLITVSKDQSTRIHSPWRTGNNIEWHEIGRPQVHGFDLTCVTSLNATTFVSGADEKISRVFKMNKNFGDVLDKVSDYNFSEYDLLSEVVTPDALGLSNKVVTDDITGDTEVSDSGVLVPKEEAIVGKTLWPEVTKLYGHVYEIFRVAAHEKRQILATCCKAAVAEYADIIIWSTTSWTIVQRLPFHKSTVVRVRFSKNGHRLVSVSKDRQWALWEDKGEGDINYQLVSHSTRPHSHSKIIWDCDWTTDDSHFVTVSRDKRMMMWDGHSGASVGCPLSMTDSINAVSTWPRTMTVGDVFAIGLETGVIHLVTHDRVSRQWTVTMTIVAHHDWITRLSFNAHVDDHGACMLASCSKDRFVKIYELSLQ